MFPAECYTSFQRPGNVKSSQVSSYRIIIKIKYWYLDYTVCCLVSLIIFLGKVSRLL